MNVLDARVIGGKHQYWTSQGPAALPSLQCSNVTDHFEDPDAPAWLYVSPTDGVTTVTLTSYPPGERSPREFLAELSILTRKYCIAEGTVEELWPLFFAHARMLV